MKISIPQLSSDEIGDRIRTYYLASESRVVDELTEADDLSPTERQAISDKATGLIKRVRQSSKPSMMENFLAEYGLSTSEGVALMCLAEALLRVPDAQTIDELIEDKLSHGSWGKHLGHSDSPLVNASTWALLLTGKVVASDDQKGLQQT